MYSTEINDLPILKITGRTLDECKEKLYEKFNSGYTIRDKRTTLKGGFFGFGQKEVVEVSYTIDRQDRPMNESRVKVQPNNQRNESRIADEEKNNAAMEAFQRTRDELLRNSQMNNLKTQIDEMKETQTTILKELQNLSHSNTDKHESIKRIETLLIENEFTPSYIEMIVEKIKEHFTLTDLDDFEAVEKKVVDWIGKSISIAKEKAYRPPHVIIIVGPTGVGKTTTLVKLAVKMINDDKKNNEQHSPSLLFVTADTMRVGAYEQLKKYNEILATQFEKAETVEDLKKIYDEKKDTLDAIFIDTSGYSPNDAENIGKMKSVLDVRGMVSDIYLAVSASTKPKDLENIMQIYEQFGYNSVIVTKCDETRQYGNIISVLNEKHKKISYITDGQKVAKDFHRADVIQFLIRLTGFDIDRVHIEDEFGE